MQDKIEYPESFDSKRHKDITPDEFDPTRPRLGRRESEPHSDEINYLYDVLSNNFPDDRTIWDLHHYFSIDDLDIDIQFDISYFKGLQIDKRLSSYKAKDHGNRVPTLAINVLSRSTWRIDIGENVDYCRKLKIPLYIVFPSYHVATDYYKPPFLRVYILQPNGEYAIKELRTITIDGDKTNPEAIIDVSDHVPFRLGLKKRNLGHQSGSELFRLIILDPIKLEIFMSRAEQAEKRAEQAEKKAEQAEKKAEQAEKKAEQAEKKAEQAEKKTEQAEKKAEQAEKKTEDAERKIKELENYIKDLKSQIN